VDFKFFDLELIIPNYEIGDLVSIKNQIKHKTL